MPKTKKTSKKEQSFEDKLRVQQSITRALLGIIAVSIFIIFFLL